MGLPLIKISVFVGRFDRLLLDGIREPAENTGRTFSDMNVKEQIHDRCLYRC